MSIKTSLSSDGLEEVFTAPTLKEMCLYKCLTNKEILTTKEMDGIEKPDWHWENFRLKEPIQKDLVEALLEAADKHMFQLTSKYEPIVAAIRMSQPEHLVKVHVSGTDTLTDYQLEWLISGGNVISLDIHGCVSLSDWSLYFINEYGSKLEYLRIGDSSQILPMDMFARSPVLRTPNLKTLIVYEVRCRLGDETNFWGFLLHDFISNLEELGMSKCGRFESLEFLEPAENTLLSFTLADCIVEKNAWAFLFKLKNLRSLDVMDSDIGKALVGENVVQRLLTALPNLTSLAVDPGLVKDISMETSSRGQGSVAKRLEFLGIMGNNDAAELRQAKFLANDVAYFGTVEGELRGLEYFSTRVTVTFNSSLSDYNVECTLEKLLKSLSEVAGTPPCNTVAVINLFLKTFKGSGSSDINLVASRILKKTLTPDVAAKLGKTLLDQCIEAICYFIRKWLLHERGYFYEETEFINHVVDIIMNLDGKLCLHHYVTVVPLVMRLAEKAFGCYSFDDDDDIGVKDALYKKIEQIFAKVLGMLKGETVSCDEDDENGRIGQQNLVEAFSSMIASLKRLWLNSGTRRAAFHSAEGVGILLDLLKKIIDGRLGLADGDTFVLLEILQSNLHYTNLELSESGMIASELEKLLLSVHCQWEVSRSPNWARGNGCYNIANLLNYLESDPRFDYKIRGAAKKIMMKIK